MQKESPAASRMTTNHPTPIPTPDASHNNECVRESWLQVCRTGCSWNVGWWCWRTSRRSIQFSHRTQEGKTGSWSFALREGTQITHDRLMINGQHVMDINIYVIYIDICHHLKKLSELAAGWEGGGLFTITLSLSSDNGGRNWFSRFWRLQARQRSQQKLTLAENKPDLNDAWRQINKRNEQTGWMFSKAQCFGSIAWSPEPPRNRAAGRRSCSRGSRAAPRPMLAKCG